MKTNCFKREVLFAYANQMLRQRERERVDTHLGACADCRSAVEGYQKLDTVLAEWKSVEPSPWFDAQARARIESSGVSQAWHVWRFSGWKRWAGVAAIVALAVITSLVAFRANRPGRSAATVSVTTAAHATPAAPAVVASALPAPRALAPGTTSQVAAAPAESASQEMDLYENLKVLENYDMLANFKVLSELPQGDKSND